MQVEGRSNGMAATPQSGMVSIRSSGAEQWSQGAAKSAKGDLSWKIRNGKCRNEIEMVGNPVLVFDTLAVGLVEGGSEGHKMPLVLVLMLLTERRLSTRQH